MLTTLKTVGRSSRSDKLAEDSEDEKQLIERAEKAAKQKVGPKNGSDCSPLLSSYPISLLVYILSATAAISVSAADRRRCWGQCRETFSHRSPNGMWWDPALRVVRWNISDLTAPTCRYTRKSGILHTKSEVCTCINTECVNRLCKTC